MEEFVTPSPEYIKAFNQGYIMQKHMPELAGRISKSLTGSERSKAFREGMKQFTLEQEKGRPKFLQKDRLKNLNKNDRPSRDRNKDNLDRG